MEYTTLNQSQIRSINLIFKIQYLTENNYEEKSCIQNLEKDRIH